VKIIWIPEIAALAGKVYKCATGFAYMGSENREKYYIGDLREHSLDDLFDICQDKIVPSRTAVEQCTGCWNMCEVKNEINYWNQRPVNFFHTIQENNTTAVSSVVSSPPPGGLGKDSC